MNPDRSAVARESEALRLLRRRFPAGKMGKAESPKRRISG
jgi:hypothetical protein